MGLFGYYFCWGLRTHVSCVLLTRLGCFAGATTENPLAMLSIRPILKNTLEKRVYNTPQCVDTVHNNRAIKCAVCTLCTTKGAHNSDVHTSTARE